tara:strand:- start:55 stop:1872 length:1818 start_codon:yes stop_codon:yes gene_type:complete
MALINFTDKEDLTTKNVPEENKIVASDMNSLKAGININEVGIASLVEGQTGGLLSFVTKADLDAYTPTDNLDSYKVTNDSTSSNNGYYHWTGSLPYVKDAELANGLIESGNVDAVSGNTSFKAIRDTDRQSEKTLVNDYLIGDGNYDSFSSIISGTTIYGHEIYTPSIDGVKIKMGGNVNLSFYKVNVITGSQTLITTYLTPSPSGQTHTIPISETFAENEFLGVSGSFGYFYNTTGSLGFSVVLGSSSVSRYETIKPSFSTFTEKNLYNLNSENEFILENQKLIEIGIVGKFLNESGVETTSAGWTITDYISVIGLSNIYITGETQGGNYAFCVFYDNLGNIITTLKKSSVSSGLTDYKITLPNGTESVRFTIGQSLVNTYDYLRKETTVVNKVNELNLLLGGSVEYVAMGDSITTGVGSSTGTYSYVDIIKSNFKDINVIKSNYTGQTIRNQIMTSYNDITVDTKIVTMFYGTNDARNTNTSLFGDVPVILAKDFSELVSGSTSMESLRLFIETVKRNFPSVLIYVFTPLKSTLNFKTEIELFISKEIELCNYLGVPIIDMYNNSGITWEDSIYTADNLHPNDNGYLLMSRYLSSVVNFRNSF